MASALSFKELSQHPKVIRLSGPHNGAKNISLKGGLKLSSEGFISVYTESADKSFMLMVHVIIGDNETDDIDVLLEEPVDFWEIYKDRLLDVSSFREHMESDSLTDMSNLISFITSDVIEGLAELTLEAAEDDAGEEVLRLHLQYRDYVGEAEVPFDKVRALFQT